MSGIDPFDFLQATNGFSTVARATYKLAVIDPNHTSGDPKVTFDGETTLSVKRYRYLNTYVPAAGDRVMMAAVGQANWVIIGAIDVTGAPATSGVTPVGGVIMFSGVIAELPDNWKLCDGSDGTPDLRGRFIVGAEGAYAQGATGGANTVTLTTAQLPGHTHGSGTLDTNSTGSHGHTSGTLSASSGSHGHAFTQVRHDGGGAQTHGHQHSGWPGAMPTHTSDVSTVTASNTPVSSSSHGHGVTGTVASNGSHSHSVSGSTASTGSGNSHENRPPYYALAYIMRVA